jgi:hypothetical protein
MTSALVAAVAMASSSPTAALGAAGSSPPAPCCDAVRLAGHEPDVNPAMRRFTGVVIATGRPDASGHRYSLRIDPIGPRSSPPQPDELKGWRLTVLAGKRFASVFRVAGNTADEIVVDAADGPVDGIEARDVFVVEEIDAARPAASGSLPGASAG